MLLVLTAVALVIVTGVALLMVRDKPLLAEDPILPPDPWPPAWPVGPLDVSEARFQVVVRGYRMEQVDRVLAHVAAALAERDEQIALLEEMAAQRAGTQAQGPPEATLDGG